MGQLAGGVGRRPPPHPAYFLNYANILPVQKIKYFKKYQVRELLLAAGGGLRMLNE